MRVPRDGAFLVRKRSEPSSYAISFRCVLGTGVVSWHAAVRERAGEGP